MTIPLPETFTFPANMALFLDFDGTLAGFQDDPNRVHLSSREDQLLLKLNVTLSGALALISGRDLRDLAIRTPKDIWRLGNHGLFRAAPYANPPVNLPDFPEALKTDIGKALTIIPGTRIEVKGPVIAIHHRANPTAGGHIVERIQPLVNEYEDHKIQTGHNVVEVKPSGANKGMAVSRQMAEPPFKGKTPVMIGDDTTDEDAFDACKELNGFGIKIGTGPTSARFRIPTIKALYTHLESII